MEGVSQLKDGRIALKLHIQPRASRNRFRGLHDGALKLTITAPPVDGKANKAVIAFLSAFFKIPKKNITLLSGHQSRRKRFALEGISLDELRLKMK